MDKLQELENRGFSFFPLINLTKRPAINGWKPYQSRIATNEEINSWSGYQNFAVVTGDISGIWILDLDVNHDVDFDYWLTTFPTGYIIRSATNGYHLYYKLPIGYTISNSDSKLARGVDTRGNGGYGVYADSQVAYYGDDAKTKDVSDGYVGTYRFESENEISDTPNELLELLIAAGIALQKDAIKQNRMISKVTCPTPKERYSPYAIKALESELTILAHAENGTRNRQLNNSAFALGQLIATSLLDRTDVEDSLFDTALALGLPEDEAKRTIQSGLNAGIEQPRAINIIAPDEFSPTDTGNAERMIYHYQNRIAYLPHKKRWLFWNGVTWSEDSENQGYVYGLAQTVAKDILLEAHAADDLEKRKVLTSWSFQSLNGYRLSEMINLASKRCEIKPDQLDSNPMLLGVKNGVVDLRTGQLIEPNPSDYITKQARANFNPDATCPRFLDYINNAMSGDMEMIRYIQKLIGYSLTGYSNEKIMMLLYGAKDTGKTMLVMILGKLLGDYSKYISAKTLMKTGAKSGSDATPDIAKLAGARLVYCDESEHGDQINAAVVKQLTGRSTRTARFLNQNFFEYEPTDKIWLATNFMPSIPTDDLAIWDRVRIIEFKHVVEPEKQNKGLQDYIIEHEIDGVLNWAIEGCLAYQAEGLKEPESAKRVKERIYGDQDSIGRFFENLEWIDSGFTPRNEMYKTYQLWCENEGDMALGKKRFNSHIENNYRQLRIMQKNGTRGYSGIKIPFDLKLGVET